MSADDLKNNQELYNGHFNERARNGLVQEQSWEGTECAKPQSQRSWEAWDEGKTSGGDWERVHCLVHFAVGLQATK